MRLANGASLWDCPVQPSGAGYNFTTSLVALEGGADRHAIARESFTVPKPPQKLAMARTDCAGAIAYQRKPAYRAPANGM